MYTSYHTSVHLLIRSLKFRLYLFSLFRALLESPLCFLNLFANNSDQYQSEINMQTNEYNPESKKGIHEDVIREIDTITASWEGIMQRESVHEAVRRFYESDDRLNVELPMETLPEHVIQQQQVNLNQRLQDMVATIKCLLDFQEYPQTQGNKRAIRIAINALLSAVCEWTLFSEWFF